MLLFTLRGTPTIYYGEEIGLKDVEISPDQVQDPAEKNEPALGLGRDPERSPMPWNGSALAGFTSGAPWLPFGEDHATRNVAMLRESPAASLHLYLKLIELRRASPALVEGQIGCVCARKNILQYERFESDSRIAVVLNLGYEPVQGIGMAGKVLLSTCLDRSGELISGHESLRANEGIVIDTRP
jgi:alpha-glucosidase